MSQLQDPKLDEVKRTLRRLQDLGQQSESELAAPDARRQPQGLSQRLAALSRSPGLDLPDNHGAMPGRFSGGTDLQDGAHDRAAGRRPGLKTIFSATLVGVCAAALALYAGIASIKRELATSRQPAPPASVALRVAPQSPPPPGVWEDNRKDAAAGELAPRLVAPAEWIAPAGAASKLPLTIETREDVRSYQIFISGLEASAFVVKGTEIISGTWIVPASELANAAITRSANAPRRAMVTVELRAASGEVLSQVRAIVLAQPPAAEAGAATTDG